MALSKSTPLLARLQTDPVFTELGSLTACVVAAYFGQNLVDDSTNPPTVTPLPWDSLPDNPTLIDYVAKATTTVTFSAAGQEFTLPYGVIGAGLVAAANQEREA